MEADAASKWQHVAPPACAPAQPPSLRPPPYELLVESPGGDVQSHLVDPALPLRDTLLCLEELPPDWHLRLDGDRLDAAKSASTLGLAHGAVLQAFAPQVGGGYEQDDEFEAPPLEVERETEAEQQGRPPQRRQRVAVESEGDEPSAGEAEGRDGQEGVAGDEAMGNASDGDVPMAAPTSFACALCTSEKPMASAVNVDGCKHPDALVCGSCMFTEIFGNAAECPLCRAPALALVRVATGRRYEVTDTTLSRNDTQGGALAAPGDPDACHTCHKFGFLFVCKGCKQNRCFRCSGLDWPPEESDPFYCDTCAAARAATNARPDRREEGETLIARIMSLGEVQSLETAAAVLSVGSDSTSISERLNPAEMVRAQKAYRWLAARIHPDKLPECGDATAAFQVLERAWSLWRHLFESSRGNAGNAGVAGYEHRSDDGADEGGAQPAAEPATPANEQQAQQRAQEASARAARFQQHQQQRVRAPDIASNGLEPLPGQQVEYAPLETSKVQRHPPLTLQTPLHWLAPPR